MNACIVRHKIWLFDQCLWQTHYNPQEPKLEAYGRQELEDGNEDDDIFAIPAVKVEIRKT